MIRLGFRLSNAMKLFQAFQKSVKIQLMTWKLKSFKEFQLTRYFALPDIIDVKQS